MLHDLMTVLCPGCPLRGFFYTMEQCKQVPILLDLGCVIHQKEAFCQTQTTDGTFCLVSEAALEALKQSDLKQRIPVVWENEGGVTEAVLADLGYGTVLRADPLDLTAMRNAVEEALQEDDPVAIVISRPCRKAVEKEPVARQCEVDRFRCLGCKKCLRVGCPAIAMDRSVSRIEPSLCVGCGVCVQVCPVDAILSKEF